MKIDGNQKKKKKLLEKSCAQLIFMKLGEEGVGIVELKHIKYLQVEQKEKRI